MYLRKLFYAQIREIERRYDEMGKDLLKLRKKRRDEISKFMDTHVEAERDELATLIMRIDADQSNVNVVSSAQPTFLGLSLENKDLKLFCAKIESLIGPISFDLDT